jgi:hypothetical protein
MLRLYAVPEVAELTIDGRDVGRAPVILRRPSGSIATVTARSPGYASKTEQLNLA